LKDFNEAKLLTTNGIRFGYYYLSVSPFVCKPKILCANCGKMDHKNCSIEKPVCLRCGFDKHEGPCDDGCGVCTICNELHSAFDCPQYQEKIKVAYNRKKKTYLEALQQTDSSKTNSLRYQKIFTHNRAENSDSYDINFMTKIIVSTITTLSALKIITINNVENLPTIVSKYAKENLTEKKKLDLNLNPTVSGNISNNANMIESQQVESPEIHEPKNREDNDTLESSLNEDNSLSTEQVNRMDESADKRTLEINSRRNSAMMQITSSYQQESSDEEESGPSKKIKRNQRKEITCSCGKAFNCNPGWKVHFNSCKDGKVTCLCGKLSLNSQSTNLKWNKFVMHAKTELMSS
jgi:hypothetical protein